MNTLMTQELTGSAMAYRRGGGQGSVRLVTSQTLAWVIFLFMSLFAASLFCVWSRAQVVRATYSLSSLRHQEKELVMHNDKLRLEIATLRSPSSLSRVATDRLKMVPPKPGQIVMVK